METLTMAQALRHMAERAEQGCETPWDDLEFYWDRVEGWKRPKAGSALCVLRDRKIRIRPKPKLVNGVECHPHRGELIPDEIYYVPSSMEQKGCVTGYGRNNFVKFAHARHCVYTTKEGALVEAKAQGWV